MGQITRPSQMLGVDSVFQKLQKDYNTAKAVNAGIDFGVSTQIDRQLANGAQDPGTAYTGNINGQWLNVTAPATANAEFGIRHHLNRYPSWYIFNSDRACHLYQLGGPPGTPSTGTPWTQSMIYLKCDVASAVLRIFIS